jgi:hypothetical protein
MFCDFPGQVWSPSLRRGYTMAKVRHGLAPVAAHLPGCAGFGRIGPINGLQPTALRAQVGSHTRFVVCQLAKETFTHPPGASALAVRWPTSTRLL